MRALRFHARKDVRLEEVPEAEAASGMVKLQVEWCGICGTDVHEYSSGPILLPTPDAPHRLTGVSIPLTLGHECAGRVGKWVKV